jgi:triosephosphate isomerase
MDHRLLIAGNWKMNLTVEQATTLARECMAIAGNNPAVEVAIFPPFVSLHPIASVIFGSSLSLGAQDVFWKNKGAYTGEISPEMLTDVGCKYCIVGHSERRGRFGVSDDTPPGFFADTDETIRRKLVALTESEITPILCVGETADERAAGKAESVIEGQLAECGHERQGSMVIAYEPVWAIGTGNVCSPEEAEARCAFIRSLSPGSKVLYGGSVKASNSASLFKMPSIDGALVGGASLDAQEFGLIVQS